MAEVVLDDLQLGTRCTRQARRAAPYRAGGIPSLRTKGAEPVTEPIRTDWQPVRMPDQVVVQVAVGASEPALPVAAMFMQQLIGELVERQHPHSGGRLRGPDVQLAMHNQRLSAHVHFTEPIVKVLGTDRDDLTTA